MTGVQTCALPIFPFYRARTHHANLSQADLRHADLRGVDFGAADLSGANLEGANLSGNTFEGFDTSAANLSGANLSGVQHHPRPKWPQGLQPGRASFRERGESPAAPAPSHRSPNDDLPF